MSRTITETVEAKSDLSGQAATQVRSFVIDGVAVELDLTDKEAGTFDKAIGRYVTKAHSVVPAPQTLRDWAREAGYEVGERGRLSADLREAFLAARFGGEVHEKIETPDAE